MLGGVTATRSVGGLWLGLVELPDLCLGSIFFGVGFFVFPALLVYAIASVRCEWPLRLTLLCTVLMWWNIHKTIRWSYDGPMAKRLKTLDAEFNKSMNEAAENAKRKNRK